MLTFLKTVGEYIGGTLAGKAIVVAVAATTVATGTGVAVHNNIVKSEAPSSSAVAAVQEVSSQMSSSSSAPSISEVQTADDGVSKIQKATDDGVSKIQQAASSAVSQVQVVQPKTSAKAVSSSPNAIPTQQPWNHVSSSSASSSEVASSVVSK